MQPPLYFLLTTLVTQVAPPDPPILLYLSRLVAVAGGAGAVYFGWAATRELSPRAPLWAAGVAGVIALLPEFCFNNARAGNDSLVNALGMACFYVWFRGLRRPSMIPACCGPAPCWGWRCSPSSRPWRCFPAWRSW